MRYKHGITASSERVLRIHGGTRADWKVTKIVAITDSKHKEPVAENILDREFSVSSPNIAWMSDITYVKIGSK